ncbi:MAG: methylmalonyl Co-A mutase-associated GTPase MeaB [Anaerolineae bacterium]|nr:methylmalonyl Co-A mutase-associated GTPase MeaB [Anaerolineae bacterium]
MTTLVSELLAGNRRALARLLSAIEDETPQAQEALAALYSHTGRAALIGVTGAPGTGKSSLVSALARFYRARGQTVGIIAVDPTSPFSGGAILGDRIRMVDLAGDPGIFIRSMATRGSLGGLARATADAIRALDAAGFDIILIETVGAGQSEVDIAYEAQTTLVVEAPGLGDDIQAIKAGILEIADILVVNKSDRPDALNTVRILQTMLDLGAERPPRRWHHGQLLPAVTPSDNGQPDGWRPPIIQTIATDGTGVAELAAAIDRHRDHLQRSGQLADRERTRLEAELASRLRDALLDRLLQQIDPGGLQSLIARLVRRELDPASAVDYLLRNR